MIDPASCFCAARSVARFQHIGGLHRLANSNSEDDDLSSMEAVFEAIAGQPWFDPDARYAFSSHFVATFPGASFDPKLHREFIEGVARTKYAMKLEQRGR